MLILWWSLAGDKRRGVYSMGRGQKEENMSKLKKKTSPEARMIHAIYPQYPGHQAGTFYFHPPTLHIT